MTADVMNAYDPVGEDENARLQLYFTCASYAAAADCLMDMREREDSFASDFDSAAGCVWPGWLRKKGVTERLQGGIAGMPQTVSTGEIGG